MHVFVLMVYMGYGDDRVLTSSNMRFYNIDHCNYVASAVVRRYSSHGITTKDRVVAYCVPEKLEDNSLPVY